MAETCIILPTYNRAKWLGQAVASITAQTYSDWELVIVDDGSTDDTRELVEKLHQQSSGKIRYVHQTNGGVGKARQTGLANVPRDSAFVAWLDSDDLWKPHHLTDCVAALKANPEVAWVFTAFERAQMDSGKVFVEQSFRENGKPKAFFELKTRQSGKLFIIDDPRALTWCMSKCQFGYLGASVFRREMFDQIAFPQANVQEDTALLVRALAAGFKASYLDQVNATVREHDDHTCARNEVKDIDKHIRIKQQAILAFESLEDLRPKLTKEENAALTGHLISDIFWSLGYALLWSNGRTREAMAAFRKGLSLDPTNKAMKRFYYKARIRSLLGLTPRRTTGG